MIGGPRSSKTFHGATFLFLGLIGAGIKESWVVFPFIGTAFLVIVLNRAPEAAMRQMRWLWLAVVLYLGVFIAMPAISGFSTATFYADFGPVPALVKVCWLILTFCGLGGLELNLAATIALAGLAVMAAVAIAIRQGNRCALWALIWTAATLALAAPFSDVALRHNYLPLVGFWMTLAFLVDKGLPEGNPGRDHQRLRIISALVASSAAVVLVMEGLALQVEIDDYRRYGDLHRELVEMCEAIESRIPRDGALLFIDLGRRQAVVEAVRSVVGVEKSFFVRRDAIWQMVFLPPLANFLGTPFDQRLRAIPNHEVPGVLGVR